ncbi:MAG: hypothetical protein L0216_01300 [Planctomycetales bacterium]|nr:hypothetical protein [Planctomycetales bacterium]
MRPPPAPALAALAAAIAYLPTLGHGFVYDDLPLLAENPFFAEAASLGTLADSRYFGSGELTWRPLATATHLLESLACGGVPSAFLGHLGNLLLHAACAALAAALAGAMLGGTLAPLACGLAVAWHPGPSEAVAVVSYREDLLCLAGLLGAVLLALRFARAGGPARAAGSLACGAVALLSKETGLVGFLLVALFAVPAAPADRRRPSGLLALGHAGLAAAYACVRLGALRHPLEEANAFPLPSGLPRVLTALRVLGEELGLLLVPWDLSADPWPPVIGSPADGRLVLPALLALALIAALVLAHRSRRAPAARAGLLWLGLTLGPTLPFAPLANLRADRFLYVPLAGFALALASAGRLLASRGPSGRRAAIAAGAFLAGFALVRLETRLPAFRDDATLWAATLREDPSSVRARIVAGHARIEAGERAEGLKRLREAAALAPGHHEPLYELGNALGLVAIEGDAVAREESESFLRQARDRKPAWWKPWHRLGELAITAGQRGDADALFAEAAGRPGGRGRGLLGRGDVAAARGDAAAAARLWAEAVAAEPDLVPALGKLGAVRLREGNRAEGRALLERALDLGADTTDVLWNLAGAREAEGDVAGAEALLARIEGRRDAPAGLAGRLATLRARQPR